MQLIVSVFFRYTSAETHLPVTAASCVFVYVFCAAWSSLKPFTLYRPTHTLLPVITHLSVSFIAHTHTSPVFLSHASCFSLSSARLCAFLSSAWPRFNYLPLFSLTLFTFHLLSLPSALWQCLSLSPPSLFLSIYCIHSFHPFTLFLIHLRSLRCQRLSLCLSLHFTWNRSPIVWSCLVWDSSLPGQNTLKKWPVTTK